MNAQKQFYDLERADKGIHRDVRDVIGELTRLAEKEALKNEKELAKKAKVTSEGGTTSMKNKLRSSAARRTNQKITYSEVSSGDENSDKEVMPVQPKNKKDKKTFKTASDKDIQIEIIPDVPRKAYINTISCDANESARIKTLEHALLEQAKNQTKIQKALEESQETLALFMKSMVEKEKKHEDAVQTKPVTSYSVVDAAARDSDTHQQVMKLPQHFEGLTVSQNTIEMTSKEFYLYNSLQEKILSDRIRQNEMTERLRQSERDGAEKLRQSERESAEKLRQSERESAEKLRQSERESSERIKQCERESAERMALIQLMYRK